jgi:hypothetical protein
VAITELAGGLQNAFCLSPLTGSKPFGSPVNVDQLAEVRDAVRLAAIRGRAPRGGACSCRSRVEDVDLPAPLGALGGTRRRGDSPCRRARAKQAIPLLDLPLPAPAPEGAEWIAAYRRWHG